MAFLSPLTLWIGSITPSFAMPIIRKFKAPTAAATTVFTRPLRARLLTDSKEKIVWVVCK